MLFLSTASASIPRSRSASHCRRSPDSMSSATPASSTRIEVVVSGAPRVSCHVTAWRWNSDLHRCPGPRDRRTCFSLAGEPRRLDDDSPRSDAGSSRLHEACCDRLSTGRTAPAPREGGSSTVPDWRRGRRCAPVTQALDRQGEPRARVQTRGRLLVVCTPTAVMNVHLPSNSRVLREHARANHAAVPAVEIDRNPSGCNLLCTAHDHAQSARGP